MQANQILKFGTGTVRGTARLAERLTRQVAGGAYGIVQEARHLGRESKPDMDDVTLARKVESEIFRGPRSPKSTVDVNVVDGVVWLRGEVKTAKQIRDLEAKTREVPEVRGVENLLHQAKTPAPSRADTPRRQQRTRSSTRRPTPARRTGGKVTDDRTDAIAPDAEPSPAEHAEQREGRTPAPLGSTGESGSQGAGSQEAGGGGQAQTAPSSAPEALRGQPGSS